MKNRIRLPIYIKQAQFPTEANRFRLSNGETKTLSVTIRKTYQLETDYLNEKLHQRLVVALNHDDVTIEGDRYLGSVAMDGEYQIEYPDFLDYPLGKGSGTLEVTPFDATNDNCQTCEEATQLSLSDDTFPEPLEEGSENEIEVFTNDSICCSPFTATISSFDTEFVDSVTIDQDTGIVTIVLKDPAPSGTNALLATYRVTCPDGSYDEANIYGTIEGSIIVCEPPGEITIDAVGLDTAELSWTASPSTPDNYGWQLFRCDDPGVVVQSGTVATNSLSLEDLIPGVCYHIAVWAICGGGLKPSITSETDFNTDSDLPSCGKFELTNNLYPTEPTGTASYMDCGGTIRNIVVKTTRTICMMTEPDFTPTYFVVDGGSNITYEYQEPC